MRFHGKIGYGTTAQDPPGSGKWKDQIIEREYFGDVERNLRQADQADKVNDDISMSNSISIVSDPYAVEHLSKIKYVMWQGVRWTVNSVEIRPPRLILNFGGVYNGPTP